MTPKDIVAKFANSLVNFKPIVGQRSYSNLKRLQEAVAPLFLQIPYDETRVVHNQINLIQPEATYVACYGKAFPKPARVGAYDKTIDDDATAVVHARTEAAHKAMPRKIRDRATGDDAICPRRRC